jgi:HSP20 family protein
MTAFRFDPFGDFDRLSGQGRGRPQSVVPMDALRRADEVVVQFDVPGVDPATIEVTVEKKLLTVSGERHPSKVEGDHVFVGERPAGHFSRQVRLGDGLDVGQVHATYELGVLTITLPVGDEVRPRRVEITTVTPDPVSSETEIPEPVIDGAVHETSGTPGTEAAAA